MVKIYPLSTLRPNPIKTSPNPQAALSPEINPASRQSFALSIEAHKKANPRH
jgi:hypothetical protein